MLILELSHPQQAESRHNLSSQAGRSTGARTGTGVSRTGKTEPVGSQKGTVEPFGSAEPK